MNNYTVVDPTWTTEIWVGLPELEYKDTLTPEAIRKFSRNQHKRLIRVADIIEKMQTVYRHHRCGHHTVEFYTNDEEEQIKEKIRKLGIRSDEIDIFNYKTERINDETKGKIKEKLQELGIHLGEHDEIKIFRNG